jgi:hypothetical protein
VEGFGFVSPASTTSRVIALDFLPIGATLLPRRLDGPIILAGMLLPGYYSQKRQSRQATMDESQGEQESSAGPTTHDAAIASSLHVRLVVMLIINLHIW